MHLPMLNIMISASAQFGLFEPWFCERDYRFVFIMSHSQITHKTTLNRTESSTEPGRRRPFHQTRYHPRVAHLTTVLSMLPASDPSSPILTPGFPKQRLPSMKF